MVDTAAGEHIMGMKAVGTGLAAKLTVKRGRFIY
jgi:hypothetical protein